MTKQRILTILGMVIVGVAIWAYFAFQSQISGNAPQFGKRVIVATKTVPIGTVLSKDVIKKDFQFLQVPKNYLANGALTNPQDMIGKKTLSTIDVNQQVTKDMLDDHSVKLGKDERLYSFPIDLTRSVGGSVFPNDVVDVNVYYPKTGQTQTVVTGIQIYTVQDSNGVEITRDKMVKTQNGPAHIQPALITIAGNEEMIKALQDAQNGGQLFLTKYANENLPN